MCARAPRTGSQFQPKENIDHSEKARMIGSRITTTKRSSDGSAAERCSRRTCRMD